MESDFLFFDRYHLKSDPNRVIKMSRGHQTHSRIHIIRASLRHAYGGPGEDRTSRMRNMLLNAKKLRWRLISRRFVSTWLLLLPINPLIFMYVTIINSD